MAIICSHFPFSGNTGAVKTYIECGADVKATNIKGQKPYDIALNFGNFFKISLHART